MWSPSRNAIRIDVGSAYGMMPARSPNPERAASEPRSIIMGGVMLEAGAADEPLGRPGAAGPVEATPSPSSIACTDTCFAAGPVAPVVLQSVVATLPSGTPQPQPSAIAGCPTLCASIDATSPAMAASVAEFVTPPCQPTQANLAPSRLAQAAQASVKAALGKDTAALVAWPAAGLSPGSALAADALAGTLRNRDGWTRIDSNSRVALPADHAPHPGVAEEWYFCVGTLTARGTGETQDTAISFCWMLDFRRVGGAANAACPLLEDIVDVQFAVAEQGAPNSALGAPVWGVEVTTQASPLVLQAGGMSLTELVGAGGAGVSADGQGLASFVIAGANPGASTMLKATLNRNMPFVMQGPGGVIGDPANGNGYLYYSAPFLTVAPGGQVVTRDAQGTLHARAITGGMAWFDHQLGTIGAPTSGWTLALMRVAAALSPSSVPMIDRGFGIVGQENWWGLMFAAGPLAGWATMCTAIAVAPKSTLKDAPVTGNWISLLTGATHAFTGGSASATTTLATRANGTWSTGYALELPLPPGIVLPGGRNKAFITATNLAADGFMRWSKGDVYSEAALVVSCSDGSAGTGWAEQVGWDSKSTATLLAALPPSSTAFPPISTWERAPADFMASGWWTFIGGLVLAVVALVLATWGIITAIHRADIVHLHGGSTARNFTAMSLGAGAGANASANARGGLTGGAGCGCDGGDAAGGGPAFSSTAPLPGPVAPLVPLTKQLTAPRPVAPTLATLFAAAVPTA